MALTKVDYVNGTTVIMAENLNAIQDEIIANGNAIGTQATAIQNLGTNKADVTALNAEASARAEADTAIDGELDELKSSIGDLEIIKHSDLLYGASRTERWFVDPSTGIGRTLGSFCSFENIEIPDGVTKLWPYNSADTTNHAIRSVCFYQSDGTFISGISGTAPTVANGIQVPANAKKVSATVIYQDSSTQTLGTYYLSTTSNGDTETKSINPEYAVSANSIIGAIPNDNIRMPCINFQFDDGAGNDALIVDIFNQHGVTCGFALISNLSGEHVARYLSYQAQGFEMLSHSVDSTGMNDATVSPETIENKLKTSKQTLENHGFKINGFVTPNSNMALVFRPILRKYYQWASTVYYGYYAGTGKNPYQLPTDGVYNIYRVSLQGTTLENQKKAVDECIANYGCLTFYGHSASIDTTDNLTTENLNALLAYINNKVSSGMCIVRNPSDCIRNYFSVRNDDISDGWTAVTATECSLDARITPVQWIMFYNDKLKLLSMTLRLRATEDIPGQIIPFQFPKVITEGNIVQNTMGREIITYSGGMLISGSGTWAANGTYRFSGLFHTV